MDTVGQCILLEFVMLTLVEPSLTFKDACLDAVCEFHAAGEYTVDAEQLGAKFEDLIARLAAAKDPANAPPGELPYEDFWLMEGDKWIGKLTLRTTINVKYLHAGGHIGYEIRPSRRRQGYGTVLLRMGLEKARERGLQRVLLTCDETNFGSRKVIENNGGHLENSVQVEGQTVLKMRYWISLDEISSLDLRQE
jgi:predicted acetyltransferase